MVVFRTADCSLKREGTGKRQRTGTKNDGPNAISIGIYIYRFFAWGHVYIYCKIACHLVSATAELNTWSTATCCNKRNFPSMGETRIARKWLYWRIDVHRWLSCVAQRKGIQICTSPTSDSNPADSSFVRVYSVASHDVKDRKIFHIDHTRSIQDSIKMDQYGKCTGCSCGMFLNH